MNIVLILAGGVGSRVGADRPKQFIKVLEKPVLAYTIDIFEHNPKIDAIEVVCHSSWIQYCQKMVKKYTLKKVRWIVPGGTTFQDSVIKGLKNIQDKIGKTDDYPTVHFDDNIFIQYGDAPFTSDKIVNTVIKMTEERGRAVTATPCYQLLASRDNEYESKTFIDRDKCIQIACPQGFRLGYLLDLYKRAKEKHLLESIDPHTTSLMYALGETIYYTYGDQTNIKITTREDLDLFEGFVRMKKAREKI